MPLLRTTTCLWQMLGGRPPPIFYTPEYRLPISGLESHSGLELRRADYVAWFLVQTQTAFEKDMHAPPRATWEELARVHSEAYLESLGDAETLARIFAVDPSDVPVDEVLGSLRLVCGGTIAAARLALDLKRATLNLFGGFHHAGPQSGGGFCALNDLAIAIAAVRADGFSGPVTIFDLDAHPPDGTAACVASDEKVWIGSISGSDWGPLPPRVDETVLPKDAGDEAYLSALDALLRRAPRAELSFVIAGGDILAKDRFGQLGLTLKGTRARESRMIRHLAGTPSVWLPGGGYHRDAWRVLAQVALLLSGRRRTFVSRHYDPLTRRFNEIMRSLPFSSLTGSDELFSQDEVDEMFGGRGKGAARLLGFYTPQGIELAWERYGFLTQLRRLGYSDFRFDLSSTGAGDQLRVSGVAEGERHVLVDCVLDRKFLDGEEFLYVNWLALRNPRAKFSDVRPRLPGQEVPGLGMAREATEMFSLVAKRLGLAGIAFKPAWYHMAYAGRARFQFREPVRQGEFEALMRDFKDVPLLETTQALADNRVRTHDGRPYQWQPAEMVARLGPPPAENRAEIERTRDAIHFSIEGAPPRAPGQE